MIHQEKDFHISLNLTLVTRIKKNCFKDGVCFSSRNQAVKEAAMVTAFKVIFIHRTFIFTSNVILTILLFFFFLKLPKDRTYTNFQRTRVVGKENRIIIIKPSGSCDIELSFLIVNSLKVYKVNNSS